ncbi:MAG: BBP7 family outer membrane beta-barrel protein [Pirellulaceae bacterium]
MSTHLARRILLTVLFAVVTTTNSHANLTRPAGPLWVSADYLMLWTESSEVPPLVTTSPAGTDLLNAGVLGQPGTRTLLGGNLNNDMRSGFRLQGGVWMDCCRTLGFQLDYFQLETLNETFQAANHGDPILARPFTDATNGDRIAELATYPGTVTGGIDASVQSEGLYDWGGNLLYSLCSYECNCLSEQLYFAFGYRGLRLSDQVRIREQLTSSIFAAGTLLDLQDEFSTKNTFHGANFGLLYRRQRANLGIDTYANVAIGATESWVNIDGQTTITSPFFSTIEHEGGLLALSSNMGRTRHADFAAIFDIGLNLRYQIHDQIWLRTGYSFLFWPQVYRAGRQIDTVVNPNLLPPANIVANDPVRPARPNRQTDYWAQGLNVGLELRY